MPKMTLDTFIKKIRKSDKPISSVRLTLKTPEDISAFIAALKNQENKGIASISKLDLSGSRFNVAELAELVIVLNTHENIKTLLMDSCKLTDDHSVKLAGLSHVVHLSLQNNRLKNRPAFSDKLQSLYLDYNAEINSQVVLHSLSLRKKALTQLSLRGCGVTDSHLKFIGSSSSLSQQLTYLNLRRNNITSEGIKNLGDLPHVATLDVSQNFRMGNQGIILIAAFSKLSALYVDGCDLTEEALPYLSKMQLATLDLSYNPGLKNLQKPNTIVPNKALKKLHVTNCHLGDVHVFIGEMFPAVTNLSIGSNAFTQAGIIDLLQKLPLQKLDVNTQELFKESVSGLLKKTTLTPRETTKVVQIKMDQKEKKTRIKDLLDAIRGATSLEHIILTATGLTEKMLLSLIPDAEKGALKTINGQPCQELKVKLEQQIESKKRAKQATSTNMSVPAKPIVESVSDNKPSMQPNPSNKPPVQLNPSDRMSQLELENQQLRAELEQARKKIKKLETQLPATPNNNSASQVVPGLNLFALEKRTSAHDSSSEESLSPK